MVKIRNYKLDNVKTLLIFLVVVGHLADFYVKQSSNMQFLYFFIYIFHMPLFIFLSGYFIKSTIDGNRFRVEKVLSFFILYILLKVAFYTLFKYVFSDPGVQFNTFEESGVAWYLLAMSIWICMTYILQQIKPAILIPITFIAGILIGYDSFARDYLIISRVIIFSPFFLLGYYINNEQLTSFLSIKKLQIVSLFIIIISIVLVYFNIDFLYQYRGLLTARNPYEKFDPVELGWLYRLLTYTLTILISLAILIITPSSKNIFTVIGERTLQIFILHMPLIYIFHHLELTSIIVKASELHWLKLYILISIPITLLLALKPFGWPFNKIMSLKYNYILKK